MLVDALVSSPTGYYRLGYFFNPLAIYEYDASTRRTAFFFRRVAICDPGRGGGGHQKKYRDGARSEYKYWPLTLLLDRTKNQKQTEINKQHPTHSPSHSYNQQ